MTATDRRASAMGRNGSLNAPDTNNATWFDPKEETEGYWNSRTDWYKTTKAAYYNHLAEINRGRKLRGSHWYDPYHTYQANRDLIEGLGNHFDLLPRQIQSAKAWIAHLDLDDFGMRAELVACCLCARIVHEDPDDERRPHPNVSADDDRKPKAFTEMPDRFGFRESEVESMYGKLDWQLGHHGSPDSCQFDYRNADEYDSLKQVSPGDAT
ncbi:hypothetical protein ACKVMT_02185 [Halobacteriales archaeon Cl-PHB]